ncbi:MAG: FliH/SctL family protein [Phycisphaerae bacterium]
MTTVIKAGEAGPILQRLGTVDLVDHLAEARAVHAAAQRQAEAVVAEARSQAKTLLAKADRDGHHAGYQRGYAEGKQAGHEAAFQAARERFDREQEDVVSSMQRAIAEIGELKRGLQVAAERSLLDFALRVAEKLTFQIGRLHRESVGENLRRALALVDRKTDLVVRMHPMDVESMESFAPAALRAMDSAGAVTLASDESLAPGGCVVQTDRTVVDARLETQIQEIAALLVGEEGDHD